MHAMTLHYTKPLLRRAVLAYWWRVLGFRTMAVLAFNAVSLGVLLSWGDRSWVVGVSASSLVLGAGFVVALYVVHYRNAISKLKAMGSDQASLQLSAANLSFSSGAGSATLPWSSVVAVWQFDSCWLLLFSRANFATLPAADISPAAGAFILEQVRAAGGDVGQSFHAPSHLG